MGATDELSRSVEQVVCRCGFTSSTASTCFPEDSSVRTKMTPYGLETLLTVRKRVTHTRRYPSSVKMSFDVSRRRLLQGGVAASVVALAGCTEEDVIAEVVEWSPRELDNPVEGTIEVDLLVHNVGAAADIEVTVEAVNTDEETDDGRQAVTESVSVIESFGRDEQRRTTANIEPGREATAILARAGPAE